MYRLEFFVRWKRVRLAIFPHGAWNVVETRNERGASLADSPPPLSVDTVLTGKFQRLMSIATAISENTGCGRRWRRNAAPRAYDGYGGSMFDHQACVLFLRVPEILFHPLRIRCTRPREERLEKFDLHSGGIWKGARMPGTVLFEASLHAAF